MPRIICIDELDKMPRTFQNQLLNFMESGGVKVDQQKKQYELQIKGAKVFPPATRLTGYPSPYSQDSESSFYRYTEEKVLPKLSSSLARYIGASVWKMEGDIRDVISIWKLVRPSRDDNGNYVEVWNGKERGGKSEQ